MNHSRTKENLQRRMATTWILVGLTVLLVALMILPATSEASTDLDITGKEGKQRHKEYCTKEDQSCGTSSQIDESEMTTLLLVGKTGVGKSATANTIVQLKSKPFRSQASAAPVTRQFQIEYSTVLGRKIKVVDSPGLGDPNMNETENINLVASEMMKAVALTPDGYDAIIVVLRFGRLSEEDKTTVDQLKAIFGGKFIAEFGIMLHTFGDTYDQDENEGLKFDEWCLQQTGLFKNLFQEFGGRAILFDNKSKDKRVQANQLKRLFTMVDDMKHGTHRYKPRMFAMAQEERDRLLLKSKEPMIRERTEMNTRFLMHELEAINLDDPETDLRKLKNIQGKLNAIMRDLKKVDNGTGVLNNIMHWVESVSNVVDKKEFVAQLAIKENRREQKFEEQMEELRRAQERAEERYRNLERPQGNILVRFLRGVKRFIFG